MLSQVNHFGSLVYACATEHLNSKSRKKHRSVSARLHVSASTWSNGTNLVLEFVSLVTNGVLASLSTGADGCIGVLGNIWKGKVSLG